MVKGPSIYYVGTFLDFFGSTKPLTQPPTYYFSMNLSKNDHFLNLSTQFTSWRNKWMLSNLNNRRKKQPALINESNYIITGHFNIAWAKNYYIRRSCTNLLEKGVVLMIFKYISTHFSSLIQPSLTRSKWNMGKMCAAKKVICINNFFSQ